MHFLLDRTPHRPQHPPPRPVALRLLKSPKAKAAKKETPKKSNATKKVTAAKGEKGTPAPKKKGAKAVQAAA